MLETREGVLLHYEYFSAHRKEFHGPNLTQTHKVIY